MIEVKADLRAKLGPARDQGARPTCLAFAASDTHAGVREGWTPLSCEYAFYQAQRRGGRPPTVGAVPRLMLDALKEDGQPEEAGWPYLSSTPSPLSLWKPPASVGKLFGRDGVMLYESINGICGLLDQATPVMLFLMLSDSFYRPTVEGIVESAATEQPDPTRKHAVVAVGHGLVDGACAVLVRNSWGASWGIDGHAWLKADFLRPRLLGTAMLLEEVDVSASPTTA